MNQLYKKENFVVVPVQNNFIIININKIFKEGHTHVNKIGVAKLLIDLALRKELPKNPRLVDRLVRITEDKKYIEQLKEFRDDAEDIDFRIFNNESGLVSKG